MCHRWTPIPPLFPPALPMDPNPPFPTLPTELWTEIPLIFTLPMDPNAFHPAFPTPQNPFLSPQPFEWSEIHFFPCPSNDHSSNAAKFPLFPILPAEQKETDPISFPSPSNGSKSLLFASHRHKTLPWLGSSSFPLPPALLQPPKPQICHFTPQKQGSPPLFPPLPQALLDLGRAN